MRPLPRPREVPRRPRPPRDRALAGCIEPPEVTIVGSDDNKAGIVHPGDEFTLTWKVLDVTYECNVVYSVNGILGGSPGFGTIDTCGHYVAPPKFPHGLGELYIGAYFPGVLHACFDCDDSASVVFTPMP